MNVIPIQNVLLPISLGYQNVLLDLPNAIFEGTVIQSVAFICLMYC